MTWAHVSNNPRVVKEADALAEAGHDVRVVAHEASDAVRARDAELVGRRGWRLSTVRIGRRHGPLAWLSRRVAQRGARALFDAGLRSAAVRDVALNPYTTALSRLAAAQPADLVVGHTLHALPAAAAAAAALGARLGFDFEDLHFAEHRDTPGFVAERKLITAVERAYLPRCDVTSASAPGIADEVARTYGVPRPTVVLNAFTPLASSVAERDARASRKGRVPLLYWYSQVIGPERGLEEAIAAIGALGMPVELHLRGKADDDFRAHLLRLAAEAGVAHALHFHAPAPADDMVALAGEHDVGLALERHEPLNRDLCVTNKILTYLAAGLAVAATATSGQREVMRRADRAGFVYPAGDARALAAGLRALLASPASLQSAKRAAAAAAAAEFSWERERDKLVSHLTGGKLEPALIGAPAAREARVAGAGA